MCPMESDGDYLVMYYYLTKDDKSAEQFKDYEQTHAASSLYKKRKRFV
jgi:hypothetical protein